MIRRNFSLIELMIVIVVIFILASLLLPALTQARLEAQRTLCIANLDQHGLSTEMYLGDHDDHYPTFFYNFSPGDSGTIVILVKPKRATANGFSYYARELLTCPSDETPGTVSVVYGNETKDVGISYGLNIDWVLAEREARMAHLNYEEVPVFFDGTMSASHIQGHYSDTRQAAAAAAIRRHRHNANVIMADGHVERAYNFDHLAFNQEFGNGSGLGKYNGK